MKGATAVSILFPILAMGLPISDTAMAIFRRWVRNLPLSSPDRRHIHHLLIGLGLNPRQAALLLYLFTGFLCGVVLVGVARGNEFLALSVGVSGCLAFLLILTTRRDELRTLWTDLRARMARGRHERHAAKATWDAIQKIELSEDLDRLWETLMATARGLGCDTLRISCCHNGRIVLKRSTDSVESIDSWGDVSGPTATFRLSSGPDLHLTVSVHQAPESEIAADIAFRFLQRLALATAERLERLLGVVSENQAKTLEDEAALSADGEGSSELVPAPLESTASAPRVMLLAPAAPGPKDPLGWLRWAFGGGRP
jgi:UDP-GlcNAc:undecaprenyl-phosphate GlcNAc-1-phosphate transferase